jgi:hypothetical protein
MDEEVYSNLAQAAKPYTGTMLQNIGQRVTQARSQARKEVHIIQLISLTGCIFAVLLAHVNKTNAVAAVAVLIAASVHMYTQKKLVVSVVVPVVAVTSTYSVPLATVASLL